MGHTFQIFVLDYGQYTITDREIPDRALVLSRCFQNLIIKGILKLETNQTARTEITGVKCLCIA